LPYPLPTEPVAAGADAIKNLALAIEFIGTSANRDAKHGVPADAASQAALANKRIQWWNTQFGWFESYYAAAGTAGLTVPGLEYGAAGWYPVAGNLPRIDMISNGVQSLAPGATYTLWTPVPSTYGWRNTTDLSFNSSTGRVTVGRAGRYRIFMNLQGGTTAQSNAAIAYLVADEGTSTPLALGKYQTDASYGSVGPVMASDVPLGAGQTLRWLYAAGPNPFAFGANPAGGRASGEFSVQYLGPGLVAS
jgi:hypothetical protein